MRGRPSLLPGPIPDDTALWLIRHGETEWSKTGRHTGRTDLALTPHGEQQALALREMVGDLQPALRAVQSAAARPCARQTLAGIKVDAIDDDLAEWDYGDYEGLTTARDSRAGTRVVAVDAPGARRRDRSRGGRSSRPRAAPRRSVSAAGAGGPDRARAHQPGHRAHAGSASARSTADVSRWARPRRPCSAGSTVKR